jgi:uncharacterized protein (DUF1778 family)
MSKLSDDPTTWLKQPATDDSRVFKLDQKHWDEFVRALAKPPADNPRLRKLLARKPAWEK